MRILRPMGIRNTHLHVGEVFHVYNRGAHKADIFRSKRDYERMQLLMHICNSSDTMRVSNILRGNEWDMQEAFGTSVEHDLVDVIAYCLMKNHIHIIARPKVDGGLQKYMQKVMTGYSMYANKVYNHSGTMWEGRFKAKHVDTDAYLWQLFAYIHVNPVEYVAKFWKDDKTLDKEGALRYLGAYTQSSFLDFYPLVTPAAQMQGQTSANLTKKPEGVAEQVRTGAGSRPEGTILTHDEEFTKFLKQYPKPKNLLEYYLCQDFSEI